MTSEIKSIILVGAGNMGGALMGGWIRNGISPSSICVLDPSPPPAIEAIIKANHIRHETDAQKLSAPDVLMVAVKPQVMGAVLQSVGHLNGPDTVTISVAAGKTLEFMREKLGEGSHVRAMPNTPSLVMRGITVGCANASVSAEQKNYCDMLLGATGSFEWVEDEALMDAVTAVSGSGPAYVFHLAEAMQDAGIKAGLPPELAAKLARETVSGAGELMAQSSDDPATLRKNVTSPGGTTQAALEVLMGEGGFPQLLEKAVNAAAKRAGELS